MLPFLKDKKSMADLITSERASDKEEPKAKHSDGMLAASMDLINAVHAKNHEAVADALQAAHEMAAEPPEMKEETNE